MFNNRIRNHNDNNDDDNDDNELEEPLLQGNHEPAIELNNLNHPNAHINQQLNQQLNHALLPFQPQPQPPPPLQQLHPDHGHPHHPHLFRLNQLNPQPPVRFGHLPLYEQIQATRIRLAFLENEQARLAFQQPREEIHYIPDLVFFVPAAPNRQPQFIEWQREPEIIIYPFIPTRANRAAAILRVILISIYQYYFYTYVSDESIVFEMPSNMLQADENGKYFGDDNPIELTVVPISYQNTMILALLYAIVPLIIYYTIRSDKIKNLSYVVAWLIYQFLYLYLRFLICHDLLLNDVRAISKTDGLIMFALFESFELITHLIMCFADRHMTARLAVLFGSCIYLVMFILMSDISLMNVDATFLQWFSLIWILLPHTMLCGAWYLHTCKRNLFTRYGIGENKWCAALILDMEVGLLSSVAIICLSIDLFILWKRNRLGVLYDDRGQFERNINPANRGDLRQI